MGITKEGNLMTSIPLADIDDTLPTKLGDAYKKYNIVDGVETIPTWRRLAQITSGIYGEPLKVPWSDGNYYILIELDASWLYDEIVEIQDLREAAGVPIGNKTRAEYARLNKNDTKILLSQIPAHLIEKFTDFETP